MKIAAQVRTASKMAPIDCKVLVIGAGPSGSSCAHSL
jgi:cation diffusion facilitator CzcD-associated flavoprotein CzcO